VHLASVELKITAAALFSEVDETPAATLAG
jgi:hypothetical protein